MGPTTVSDFRFWRSVHLQLPSRNQRNGWVSPADWELLILWLSNNNNKFMLFRLKFQHLSPVCQQCCCRVGFRHTAALTVVKGDGRISSYESLSDFTSSVGLNFDGSRVGCEYFKLYLKFENENEKETSKKVKYSTWKFGQKLFQNAANYQTKKGANHRTLSLLNHI